MGTVLTVLGVLGVAVFGGLLVILVLGALLAMGAAATDEARDVGRD